MFYVYCIVRYGTYRSIVYTDILISYINRCVRSDLVSPGQVTRQWSNRDTDNKKHKEFRDPISFWNVKPDPLDPTGKLIRMDFFSSNEIDNFI